MNTINKILKISSLIIKKKYDKISIDEINQISNWEQKFDININKEILNKNKFEKYNTEQSKINANYYYTKCNKIINRKKKKRFIKRLNYAASILIIFSVCTAVIGYISISLYKEYLSNNYKIIVKNEIKKKECKKAELTLSTGQKIVLENNIITQIKEKNGSVINKASNELNYNKQKSIFKENKPIYNTLNIKKGWEYNLVLSDGTKVWLNSLSQLKYPVKFSKHNRIVELKGEAYFKVKPNSKSPFIVKTNNYNIKVLGTSFNISTYTNDVYSKTTLVEGKVKIIDKKGNTKFLTPNKQLIYNTQKQTSKIIDVDASKYTLWTQGFFYFNNEKLNQVFKKLDRWYTIKFEFIDPKIKNELFTGKIPRFKNIDTILKMISKVSKVKFKKKNDKILIYK